MVNPDHNVTKKDITAKFTFLVTKAYVLSS